MADVWTRLRTVPSWCVLLLAGVCLLMLPILGIDFSLSRQIQLACILALLTSGLNLSLGLAGELALGQAAMYAAGAYTAGILAKSGTTDIGVQLAAGGVVALLVGIATGIPGLRLGSWSLAMTSFFLVLMIPDIIAIFEEHTGGRVGLTAIPRATLAGTSLSDEQLYYVIAIVTLAWFLVVRNIVESRMGRALRVLKQSPILASSSGISVFRMKLTAYALGSFPAGLAGVLFANLDLYLSPEAFGFVLATSVLAASILGGSASVFGAAFGAGIMQFGPNQSTEFREYALVFTGAFLILGGVLLRGGLAEVGTAAMRRLDRVFGRVAVSGLAGASTDFDLRFVGSRLQVDGVSKSFGGNQALLDVSIAAEPGEVTALIGPNGSGKTTLLNMIGGFYRADSGAISLDDQRMHGLRSHRIAQAGVARTFQTPNVPDGLSVAQAVASGRYAMDRTSLLDIIVRTARYRRVQRADLAATRSALELVGMEHLAGTEAASLPLGQRRMLEVARALVSEPRLLLLDEAASGLDEDEVQLLAQLVRTVCARGGSVILVEHNFRLVLELADVIHVLAQGQVIASGTPDEIESNPRVATEYLGLQAADESVDGSNSTPGGDHG